MCVWGGGGSISQSVSQAGRQSVSASINQSVSQAVNLSIYQSINLSISQSVTWEQCHADKTRGLLREVLVMMMMCVCV